MAYNVQWELDEFQKKLKYAFYFHIQDLGAVRRDKPWCRRYKLTDERDDTDYGTFFAKWILPRGWQQALLHHPDWPIKITRESSSISHDWLGYFMKGTKEELLADACADQSHCNYALGSYVREMSAAALAKRVGMPCTTPRMCGIEFVLYEQEDSFDMVYESKMKMSKHSAGVMLFEEEVGVNLEELPKALRREDENACVTSLAARIVDKASALRFRTRILNCLKKIHDIERRESFGQMDARPANYLVVLSDNESNDEQRSDRTDDNAQNDASVDDFADVRVLHCDFGNFDKGAACKHDTLLTSVSHHLAPRKLLRSRQTIAKLLHVEMIGGTHSSDDDTDDTSADEQKTYVDDCKSSDVHHARVPTEAKDGLIRGARKRRVPLRDLDSTMMVTRSMTAATDDNVLTAPTKRSKRSTK